MTDATSAMTGDSDFEALRRLFRKTEVSPLPRMNVRTEMLEQSWQEGLMATQHALRQPVSLEVLVSAPSPSFNSIFIFTSSIIFPSRPYFQLNSRGTHIFFVFISNIFQKLHPPRKKMRLKLFLPSPTASSVELSSGAHSARSAPPSLRAHSFMPRNCTYTSNLCDRYLICYLYAAKHDEQQSLLHGSHTI